MSPVCGELVGDRPELGELVVADDGAGGGGVHVSDGEASKLVREQQLRGGDPGAVKVVRVEGVVQEVLESHLSLTTRIQ